MDGGIVMAARAGGCAERSLTSIASDVVACGNSARSGTTILDGGIRCNCFVNNDAIEINDAAAVSRTKEAGSLLEIKVNSLWYFVSHFSKMAFRAAARTIGDGCDEANSQRPSSTLQSMPLRF